MGLKFYIYILGFIGLILLTGAIIIQAKGDFNLQSVAVLGIVLLPMWLVVLLVGIPSLIDDIKYRKGI